MDDDAWPKMVKFHKVGGRQLRGQPRKRLYDVINEDMKILKLSNEDANNRAEWIRAIKPKKKIQHDGVLPAHVDPGR